HVSQAAPDDGPGAELVVPDVRSQPADLRRHLSCEGRRLPEGGTHGLSDRRAAVVSHAADRRAVIAVRLPAFALRASARSRRSSAGFARSEGGKPHTTTVVTGCLAAA